MKVFLVEYFIAYSPVTQFGFSISCLHWHITFGQWYYHFFHLLPQTFRKQQKITCDRRFLLTPFPVVLRSNEQCINKLISSTKQAKNSQSFFCRIFFFTIKRTCFRWNLELNSICQKKKQKNAVFHVRLTKKCDMTRHNVFLHMLRWWFGEWS